MLSGFWRALLAAHGQFTDSVTQSHKVVRPVVPPATRLLMATQTTASVGFYAMLSNCAPLSVVAMRHCDTPGRTARAVRINELRPGSRQHQHSIQHTYLTVESCLVASAPEDQKSIQPYRWITRFVDR